MEGFGFDSVESIDGGLEFLVCQSKSGGKGNVPGADN